MTYTGICHLKDTDGAFGSQSADPQCLCQEQLHRWPPWGQLLTVVAADGHVYIWSPESLGYGQGPLPTVHALPLDSVVSSVPFALCHHLLPPLAWP